MTVEINLCTVAFFIIGHLSIGIINIPRSTGLIIDNIKLLACRRNLGVIRGALSILSVKPYTTKKDEANEDANTNQDFFHIHIHPKTVYMQLIV